MLGDQLAQAQHKLGQACMLGQGQQLVLVQGQQLGLGQQQQLALDGQALELEQVQGEVVREQGEVEHGLERVHGQGEGDGGEQEQHGQQEQVQQLGLVLQLELVLHEHERDHELQFHRRWLQQQGRRKQWMPRKI
jgi:hypothetical protein